LPVPGLVFAGSSEFAVPTLEALARPPWTLAAVLTQPDRPAGRRRRRTPTPVRERAEALGLTVLTPASLKAPEALEALVGLSPGALVVVDYGLILPSAILSLPAAGCINGHASLLPRWRGAAPIQHAVLAGDAETGVSVMRMEAGLDTGPVYRMQSTPIGKLETAGELRIRLAGMCAALLVDTLPGILAGELRPTPQDAAAATWAGKLAPEKGRLDWAGPAGDLARRVLAFSPRPGAWTGWRGGRLRLLRATALPERAGEPGRVWRAGSEGIDVAAGEGSVRVLELQAAGGRVLDAGTFLRGRPLLDERFG